MRCGSRSQPFASGPRGSRRVGAPAEEALPGLPEPGATGGRVEGAERAAILLEGAKYRFTGLEFVLASARNRGADLQCADAPAQARPDAHEPQARAASRAI